LIVGRPNLVSEDTVCTFSLLAYTGSVTAPTGQSETREFTFTVKNNYSAEYINVSLPLSGKDRLEWITWNNSTLISDSDIYRITDANFGRIVDPTIYISGGLVISDPSSPVNGFVTRMGSHHRRIRLFMDELQIVEIQDEDRENTIYEALIVPLVDPGAGQSYSVTYPHQTTPRIDTISPATIQNMRRDLRTNIGYVRPDNGEILPQWMYAQRVVGGTMYYGYQPALVVAYLKAGTGSRVLASITARGLNTTFDGREVDIDRYLVSVIKNGGRSKRIHKYVKFPNV